jgi:hypothetical protein
LDNIHPLTNGFGLLEEREHPNYFISLIFLDISRQSFHKLHTVEYPTHNMQIIINKSNPTTFLLNDRNGDEKFSRICKITDNTIIIGERVNITFSPACLYDKYLYSVERYDENSRYLDVRIL